MHSLTRTCTRTHSTHMSTYTDTYNVPGTLIHTGTHIHTYLVHTNTNTCYMNQARMKMWVLTETLIFEVFHGKTQSRISTARRSNTDVSPRRKMHASNPLHSLTGMTLNNPTCISTMVLSDSSTSRWAGVRAILVEEYSGSLDIQNKSSQGHP